MLQLNTECHTGLEKYELLSQLAATNVTLLYYVLIHNIADLAPVVYTPTVGEACQKFDRIYRLSTPEPTVHQRVTIQLPLAVCYLCGYGRDASSESLKVFWANRCFVPVQQARLQYVLTTAWNLEMHH